MKETAVSTIPGSAQKTVPVLKEEISKEGWERKREAVTRVQQRSSVQRGEIS